MDYKKFYDLEGYLLNEVGPRFRQTGRLDALDLYAILHWKAPRAKTKHLARLQGSSRNVDDMARELAADITKATSNKAKLEMLLSEPWEFRLPTASAILTVLYPNDFTVYDRRVAKELGDDFVGLHHLRAKKVWPRYEAFLAAVRAAMPQPTLRDADRYLWGRSLYRDLSMQIGRKLTWVR